MSQQQAHIPKFGSWDADNVPYTAYFENARKDKGTGSGVMINPNDPEQNPQAFMNSYLGEEADDVIAHKNVEYGNNQSMTSSQLKASNSNKQRKTSNSKEKISYYSQPPPSPGPNRPRFGYNPADDIASHRSASVPMFGAWDEKDPKSAEGFTVIFQKVKEEKHIAATNFPPIPKQSAYNPNTSRKDTKRIKKWCCLC